MLETPPSSPSSTDASGSPASASASVSALTRPGLVVFLLGFLNALTPFTIDLYLPAFADIARDLGTTTERISLSIPSYFVGFALGQLLYGPFLDRYGRRKPIYFGLALYVAASIGCMTEHSFEALIVFRFFSALGGAAASVGAITMVRDYFPPDASARIYSMLMLVLSISPLAAPSVGAFVAAQWGWRTIFAILAGIAILNVPLVAFGLPMHYRPDASVSLRLGPILRNFKEALRVREFWVATVAGALAFSGLFVYIAASPGIFLEGFGVSKAVYSGIFAILAAGMIGGGQLNHILVKRFGSLGSLRGAVALEVVFSALFLAGTLLHALGMTGVVAALFGILVCAGIAGPNSAAVALAPFTRNVGSASSLMGFLQMGIGATISACVGLLNIGGTLPTAVCMAGASVLALGLLRLLKT